jgi:signal transduction histidine kinase
MPAAVFLLGVLSLLMLILTKELHDSQRANFALTNALMDMQINAATSHLWLEEFVTEDAQEDLAKAVSSYAEAMRLSEAILHGGESEHGYVLPPMKDPDLRTRAKAIASQISAYGDMADERQSEPKAAGPGSDIDERFDEVFAKLQAEARALEEIAEKKQESDYAKTTHLFSGMFFAWSLIVIVATAGLWHHESRRKQAETRREQLVGELASVNRELNDFATIVSHDLEGALRAIGLSHLARDGLFGHVRRTGQRTGESSLSRVRRLDRLIGCILEYSRAGCAHEEKTEVNLNGLVSNVIDMLCPPDNIRLIVENELPVMVCQKARFEQVFQNLLSNAIKFMDKPKGEIRIGCVAEDGNWKFSVADNGPGIENKDFEKIFLIFRTLKSRDESESTGFGLALVKKIVEMYGGRIWVESEIGRGSIFLFYRQRDRGTEIRRMSAMRQGGQYYNPLSAGEPREAGPAIFAAIQRRPDATSEAE